jgi:hypothetical protein
MLTHIAREACPPLQPAASRAPRFRCVAGSMGVFLGVRFQTTHSSCVAGGMLCSHPNSRVSGLKAMVNKVVVSFHAGTRWVHAAGITTE